MEAPEPGGRAASSRSGFAGEHASMPKSTFTAVACSIAALAALLVVAGEVDARFAWLEIVGVASLFLVGVIAVVLAVRRALFERRSSTKYAAVAFSIACASAWTFVAPRGEHDPRRQPTLLGDALFTIDEVCGDVFVVSDCNHDGVGDLVAVRGPRTNGSQRIDLLSGANGALLRTLWTPDSDRDHLRALCAGPDVDGDGASELLFGGITFDGLWRAKLISSRNGSVLRRWASESEGEALGSSLAFLGDLDGDGVDELAIGAPRERAVNGGKSGVTPPGSVRVVSGASGAELLRIDGAKFEADFGSYVRALGDLDGDGVREWLVEFGELSSAPARIYSGLSSTPTRTLDTGRGWGDVAGDLDGDGTSDLYFDSFTSDSDERMGGARLLSGRDGTKLFTLAYPDWTPSSYGCTAALGDLDGDGFAEIGVGEPNFHIRGPGDPGFDASQTVHIERMSLDVALRIGSDPWCAFTHESGCAWIYSGKTREVIWGAWGPPGSREGLGYRIVRLPDINADGAPDVLVTSGSHAFAFAGPGRAR